MRCTLKQDHGSPVNIVPILSNDMLSVDNAGVKPKIRDQSLV